MLKFFLLDYAGLCLFVLFVSSGVLFVKQQWLYGALGLLVFVSYLGAVVMYGTTTK